ncbi:MAG: hypothetical protein ACREIA_12440 [Opitutaceae bacterium]
MQRVVDSPSADAELGASACRRAAGLGWRLSEAQAAGARWRLTWHPPKGPDMPCPPAESVERALAIACGKLLDWHAEPAKPSGPDLSPFGVRGPTPRR